MIEEITSLVGKVVMTHKGISLGVVEDVIVDIENSIIDELLLTETNPELVSDGRDLSIPYRWVKGISDIIILRYFPGRVKVRRKMRGKRKLRVSARNVRRRASEGREEEEWGNE